MRYGENGGEGGIRTHGTVSRTLAFEASAFNRSATSPRSFTYFILAEGLCRGYGRLRGERWLTARGEKRLKQGDSFGGEDASGDFDLMVEAGVGKDFEAGPHRAPLGIVGAVDETWHAGLDDGAGAHAAGLDGDVERRVGKPIISEQAGSFAKDDDFGVGGGVIITDGAIAGTGKDLVIVDDDGANWNLACGSRGQGFTEGFLHELDI